MDANADKYQTWRNYMRHQTMPTCQTWRQCLSALCEALRGGPRKNREEKTDRVRRMVIKGEHLLARFVLIVGVNVCFNILDLAKENND